jgi:hypothetical protein
MSRELEPLPPEADQIKPGTWWKHYKGGIYKVIGVGRHSETLECMIWYKSLEHDTEWGRPLSEWLKPLEDGSPRFVKE